MSKFFVFFFAALVAFVSAKPGIVAPLAYTSPVVSAYSGAPVVSTFGAAYPAVSAYNAYPAVAAYPHAAAYSAYPAYSAAYTAGFPVVKHY